MSELKALGCHFAWMISVVGCPLFLSEKPAGGLSKIDGVSLKTDAMPSLCQASRTAVSEATIASEMVEAIARIASVMEFRQLLSL